LTSFEFRLDKKNLLIEIKYDKISTLKTAIIKLLPFLTFM
jgi:hypothetical protein